MKILLMILCSLVIVSCCWADTIEDIKQYAMNNNVNCYEGMSSCTVMYCGESYIDSNGEWNYPEPCNSCTTEYRCSDGKTFETDMPGFSLDERKWR